MNITKRRATAVVGRDKVRRKSLTPLLDSKYVLRPEYDLDDSCQLYELMSKKRKDVDRIPVPVALFGKPNNFESIFLYKCIKCIKIRRNISLSSFYAWRNIWRKTHSNSPTWVR